MNTQTGPAGDALLVRAFQTDPSWYAEYWYGPVQPAAPGLIRCGLAALASSTIEIIRLHRLIVERPRATPAACLRGTAP